MNKIWLESSKQQVAQSLVQGLRMCVQTYLKWSRLKVGHCFKAQLDPAALACCTDLCMLFIPHMKHYNTTYHMKLNNIIFNVYVHAILLISL